MGGWLFQCVFCVDVEVESKNNTNNNKQINKKLFPALDHSPCLSPQPQESPVLPAGEFSEPFVHFITQW